MNEKEIYEFYNDRVKYAYSEIEARGNEIPVELLFEIHSAFDHLKRFHLGEDTEEHAAEKAYSHLKRGVLDAYKLKLKYFNSEYDRWFKKNPELKIIDSGDYLPKALKQHKEIIDVARKARLSEGRKDDNNAFECWYKTSVLVDEFEEEFFDETKLSWAKKQGMFQSGKNFIIGVVTGVIASGIFALIMYLI